MPIWWMEPDTSNGSGGGGGGDPVATPVLAVSDNGDGTGGVATVSSATTGTTNTLYSQPMGSTTWTSRGSRTGNGNITISPVPAMGNYWWKVVSTDGITNAVSNVVFQSLTDTELPIHERLLIALQGRLVSLTFASHPEEGLWPAGSIGSNIVIRTPLTDLEGHIPSFPCIVLGLTGKETVTAGGTNLRDEVDYPIGIVLFAASNRDLISNRAWYLKVREQIVRACQNWRTSDVPELNRTFVETDPILSLPQWSNGLLASAVVVKGRCWQTRGLT